MRKQIIRPVLFAAILASSALSSADLQAAGVPQTITHQGRLYDANDKPINTALPVQFSIYADTMTKTSLWTETDMITFDDGYFSVSLGATTPFGAGLFDGSVLYLGITVGTDPEMTPRVPVQSVPYAILAGDVNGDIHPTSVVVNNQTVIDSSGQWTGSPTGMQGPTGPQGPQGQAGPQGPTGAVGPTGAIGLQGSVGPAGPTGAQGPAGPVGATGAQGPAGPTGAQGAQGVQGIVGPQGLQGPQGVVGSTGPVGPQGAAGSMGPTGANGATGPAGPTGSAGLSGISQTAVVSGGVATEIGPMTPGNYFWAGSQASVTVASGQRVTGSGSIAWSQGGAAGIDVRLCYASGGNAPAPFVSGLTNFGMNMAAAGKATVSESVVLPAGTYDVGVCVIGPNGASMGNSAGYYVDGWFLVTN